MTDRQKEIFEGPLIEDRYRLGRALGKGGQGVTTLALDTRTGERVAIKRFSLDKAENWKELELFERECRVLRKLKMDGVPRYLHDFSDEEAGDFFLVMEYVPGISLREWLSKNGPLDEAELWDVLTQVTTILAALHQRIPPIVHRDVKPANLVRRPDGRVELVDFGGVRDAMRGSGNTMVGTFGYMAPEQLHGEATPATDLFGLGATIIALGTGVEPEDLPRKGLRMDFEARLGASKDLSRLLRKLVEPDPADRPRSGTELLKLLRSAGYLPRAVAPGPAHPRPSREPEPISATVPAAGPRSRQDTPPLPPEVVRALDEDDRPAEVTRSGVVSLFLAFIGVFISLGLLSARHLLIPILFFLWSLVSEPRERERIRGLRTQAQDATEQWQRTASRWILGPGARRRGAESRRQRRQRRRELAAATDAGDDANAEEFAGDAAHEEVEVAPADRDSV